MRSLMITTTNMGSCWRGDCYCVVYSDGTIQYKGLYSWQKSERRQPIKSESSEWQEPMRHYHSEITEFQYLLAIKAMREGYDYDWWAQKCREIAALKSESESKYESAMTDLRKYLRGR